MCKQGTVTLVRIWTPEGIGSFTWTSIDSCIAPLVQIFNHAGIRTVASCCGHGQGPGNIALEDGRELYIFPNHEASRELDAVLPSLVERRRELWPESKTGDDDAK